MIHLIPGQNRTVARSPPNRPSSGRPPRTPKAKAMGKAAAYSRTDNGAVVDMFAPVDGRIIRRNGAGPLSQSQKTLKAPPIRAAGN